MSTVTCWPRVTSGQGWLVDPHRQPGSCEIGENGDGGAGRQNLAGFRNPGRDDAVGRGENGGVRDLLLHRRDQRFGGGALGPRSLDLLPARSRHQLVELGPGGGDRALRDFLSGRSIITRFLGRRAPIRQAGQAVEVTTCGVKLGLGLGHLVLGAAQVLGPAAGKEQAKLGIGGLGVGPCLGQLVLGVNGLEPGHHVAGGDRFALVEWGFEETASDLCCQSVSRSPRYGLRRGWCRHRRLSGSSSKRTGP